MNCQISFIVAAAAAAVTAVTAVTAAVISEGGSVGFQTDADRVVSLSIPDIAVDRRKGRQAAGRQMDDRKTDKKIPVELARHGTARTHARITRSRRVSQSVIPNNTLRVRVSEGGVK